MVDQSCWCEFLRIFFLVLLLERELAMAVRFSIQAILDSKQENRQLRGLLDGSARWEDGEREHSICVARGDREGYETDSGLSEDHEDGGGGRGTGDKSMSPIRKDRDRAALEEDEEDDDDEEEEDEEETAEGARALSDCELSNSVCGECV